MCGLRKVPRSGQARYNKEPAGQGLCQRPQCLKVRSTVKPSSDVGSKSSYGILAVLHLPGDGHLIPAVERACVAWEIRGDSGGLARRLPKFQSVWTQIAPR